MQIEDPSTGVSGEVRTVNRAAPAALLVTDGQRWPTGEKCTPADAEALIVTLGREVGRSHLSQQVRGVVVVVITDGTGKVAAQEKIRRGGDAAGITQRLAV